MWMTPWVDKFHDGVALYLDLNIIDKESDI